MQSTRTIALTLISLTLACSEDGLVRIAEPSPDQPSEPIPPRDQPRGPDEPTNGKDASEPDANPCVGTQQIVTVEGSVIDPFGLPVKGAQLLVDGRLTTSDEGGGFTMDAVAVPYTIAAATQSRGAIVLSCLHRTDPVVLYSDPVHPDGTEAAQNLAFVTVTVSDAPAGTTTSVFAGGTTDAGLEVRTGDWEAGTRGAYTTEYTLKIEWRGSSPLETTVHALQWTPPAGGTMLGSAVDFVGYGSQQVMLADGDDISVALDLADVAELMLQGKVQPPEDFHYQDRHFFVDIGNARSGSFGFASTPIEDLEFSVAVPDIEGARYVVDTDGYSLSSPPQISAQASRSTAIQNDATKPLQVVLHRGAETVAPAPGAVVVGPSPKLERSAESSGVMRPQVICSTDDGTEISYAVRIWTMETSIELPDLAPLGIELPAGALCRWDVWSFPDSHSIDDVAEKPYWLGYTDLCGYVPQLVPSQPSFAGSCTSSGDWVSFGVSE